MSKHSGRWGLWLQWIFATAIGVGLCSTLFGSLQDIGNASFFTMGGFVGAVQWWVLRWRVPRANRWMLASLIGGVLGGAVWFAGLAGAMVAVLRFPNNGLAPWLIQVGGWCGYGLVLGIAQWWVLRRKVLRSGWWILANGMGFLVAGTLYLLISVVFGWTLPYVSPLAIASLINGVVQASVLRRLL